METLGPEIEQSELVHELLAELESRRGTAIGRNEEIKKKWSRYVLRKYGVYQGDDSGDELVQLGGSQQILAKFIDQLKALVLAEIFPDLSEMDFFEFESEWPGLEELAHNITALLRSKFKSMKPENSDNFYELMDQLLDDLCTLGNVVAIVDHEMIEGELDTDPIIQGPVVNRLNPFNVTPEDLTVDKIDSTNVFIYSPITEEELDVFYPKYAEYIRQNYAKTSTVIEPTTSKPSNEDGQVEDDNVQGIYERQIFLGQLPLYTIIENKFKDEGKTRNQLIDELAMEFGFDPQKAYGARYWQCEWVGNLLAECKPYPIALPKGKGPIEHLTLIPRNGYVWGHGLFDRAGFQERLRNNLDRARITITKKAANPPVLVYRECFDEEWLQEHEDNVSISDGEVIPCTISPNVRRPWEWGDVNVAALPYINDMVSKLDQSMRELTGISGVMEGFDQSKTATQSSLNLQQSQVLSQYITARVTYLFLKPIVERAYVVQRQAMTEAPGLVEYAPVSYAESQIKQLVPVSREHMRQLEYFYVKMTGRVSPGNKAAQAQALTNAFQMFAQTGGLDLLKFMRLYFKMNDVSDPDGLLVNIPQEVMAARVYTQQSIPGAPTTAPLPQMGSAGPTGAQMMIGGGGNNNPQGNNQMQGGQQSPVS